MSQSSIQVLVESLEKKSRLLDDIIQENDVQENIFKQGCLQELVSRLD